MCCGGGGGGSDGQLEAARSDESKDRIAFVQWLGAEWVMGCCRSRFQRCFCLGRCVADGAFTHENADAKKSK